MKTLYDLFRVNDVKYNDLESESDKQLVENAVKTLEEDEDYKAHILNIINAYPEYYICLNCPQSTYSRIGLHADMFGKIVGILEMAKSNKN